MNIYNMLLSSAPALALSDYNRRYELHTDASACGVGAMLIKKGRET